MATLHLRRGGQRADVAGWVGVAGAGQQIEGDRRAPGRRPRDQAGQRADDSQALDQRAGVTVWH